MNPTSSYTFTSCPTECSYVDSQAYMRYSTNQPNFHYGCFQPRTNFEQPTTSANHIHINPRICAPRNIYINRALYSCQTSAVPVEISTPPKKTERVYYNPKFFKNSSALTKTVSSSMYSKNDLLKQEVNIHLNPIFFKKDINSAAYMSPAKSPVLSEASAYNRPIVSSGIHINPAFLKTMNTKSISENIDPINNVSENITQGSDYNSLGTPRQKYITKYKIVRKKISPAIMNDPSVLKKANLKKINLTPTRKGKFKIVKGKCLKYISPRIANQKYNYINKYSLKRSTSKSKLQVINSNCKIYPSHANQNINLAFKPRNFYKSKSNMSLSYKKSVLQLKIEARRRVKSSLNQNFLRNFPFKPKNNYSWSSNIFQRQFKVPQKSSFKKNEISGIDSSKAGSSRFSSEFKSIGQMKLVRKSVLQKQIESRMHARKTPSSISLSPRLPHTKKVPDKVSIYKFVRTVNTISGTKPLSSNKTSNNRIIKKKSNLLKFSSDKYRSEKLKKVAVLTKKLRKNNQPCPLYHRFGRCKGKDKGTCPKLHDSKYIAICKRFLKGDCKDEKCTLSHDIRPEKMPTCHHYLAGLCKRTDCPYLHIKVNQKAPICRSFLQGFCADVFNCTKRHEFICPTFAEKGSCPRGKSCCLPHRTGITASKLLEPDEFPLLCRQRKEKQHKPKVSMANECASTNSSHSSETIKENKKTEFKRYFLALPPDDIDESNTDSDETPEQNT